MADTVKTVTCADCGAELTTWHQQVYHACPQQAAANRRAQRRRRDVDVLDEVSNELMRGPMPPR